MQIVQILNCANRMSKIISTYVFGGNTFVGVAVTIFWTSTCPKAKSREYVNFWSKEWVTSSDVQGFHTVNEETYGKKKPVKTPKLTYDFLTNVKK